MKGFYEIQACNDQAEIVMSIKVDSFEKLASIIHKEMEEANLFTEVSYVDIWKKIISENGSNLIYIDTINY